MQRMELRIDGMSCGHCVAAVRGALEALRGVEVERVAMGTASLAYPAGSTTPAEIHAAIRAEGYEPATDGE